MIDLYSFDTPNGHKVRTALEPVGARPALARVPSLLERSREAAA